jgi:hypothetical protein
VFTDRPYLERLHRGKTAKAPVMAPSP